MTDEELEAMHERKRQRTLARKTKKIRKIQYRRTVWILFAAFVVLIDQITKWAVMEKVIRPVRYQTEGLGFFEWFANRPSIIPYTEIPITSYFNIVLAWNRGVSFSLFSDVGAYAPVILIFVALIIVMIFGLWLWSAEKHFQCFCNALVIGGALGNVVDRARFGAVIDFLDFHINDIHWPAFNVADMAVVAGISLLIIVSLFFENKNTRRYRKSYKKRQEHKKYMRERFKVD